MQDFLETDFLASRMHDDSDYLPDQARARVLFCKNLVFGQLCNFVQYFADIGGFDAITNLLTLNHFEMKAWYHAQESKSSGSGKVPEPPVQIPIAMTQYLFGPLKNLKDVLKVEVS